MLRINNWFGRAGNNIHQLVNVILLSEKIGSDYEYPDHDLLTKSNFSNIPTTIEDTFFYRSKYELLSDLTEQVVRETCLNKVKPLMVVDSNNKEEKIVIHLRNGDIFNPHTTHSNYIQPPLKYYLSCIENEKMNYEDVLVLSHNTSDMNPVSDELKQLGCHIISTSEKEAIKILMSASKVIASLSSFSKYFYYMSPYAETLYIPDFSYKGGVAKYASVYGSGISGMNVYCANIPNYIEWGKWSASQEQKDFMKTYKEKINFSQLASL